MPCGGVRSFRINTYKKQGRGPSLLTGTTGRHRPGASPHKWDRLTCLNGLAFGCLPVWPESESLTRRAHRILVGRLALADAAIPALALLEFEQGLQQLRSIEIRPQRFRHED